MVARAAAPQTASLRVRIFDGHRVPFPNPKGIFIRKRSQSRRPDSVFLKRKKPKMIPAQTGKTMNQ